VPLVRQYQCADGRWVQIHTFTSRFLQQFAEAAGVESWVEERVLSLGGVIRKPAVRAELQRRMEELFRTRPAAEWETLLSGHGLCAAVCRTGAEWLREPHPRASGAVIEVDSPRYGRMLQPGPQVRITPNAVAPGVPRPLAPVRSKVLEGVRVIDL